MTIQRYKGTRDLTPEDMQRFHVIEHAFRTSCLRWGYAEVKTPVIEYLHLFTSAGTLTPTMLSRVYSFLDWDGWSGERVVLRPDVTIPVARFYINKMADKPVARLFYVANVFGYEETGKKTRERWQCGAELVGATSYAADVELIMLALEVLGKTGLKDIKLHLSHAGIIKSLLKKLALSADEQQAIFDRMLDGDEAALAEVKTATPEMEKVLNLLLGAGNRNAGFIRDSRSLLLETMPEIKPELDNFIAIIELLQSLGAVFTVDFTSVRGFEYYTGVIFQLFRNGEKIGGGGRYDDLISSMGAKATPASGFALYLDRLMDLIDTDNTAWVPAQAVLLIAGDNRTIKESFEIAAVLRNEGYNVELSSGEEAPGDRRWKIRIRVNAPCFLLTDLKSGKWYEANSSEELLNLLHTGNTL